MLISLFSLFYVTGEGGGGGERVAAPPDASTRSATGSRFR